MIARQTPLPCVVSDSLHWHRCVECGARWFDAEVGCLLSCGCKGERFNVCPHKKCERCRGYQPLRGV